LDTGLQQFIAVATSRQCSSRRSDQPASLAPLTRRSAQPSNNEHASDTAAVTSAKSWKAVPGARLWCVAAFKEHHAAADAFAALS
jgi:hypothetical protein